MSAPLPCDLDPARVEQTLLDAAAAAAGQTLPRFRTPLAVENKWSRGFDPVTQADTEAELAIRRIIEARFPDHGIVGEEWDPKTGHTPFDWIIDPIDGTRAFIAGVPVWGTLVGLCQAGRAQAGLMAQPFTGEIYLGLPGKAVYRHKGQERALRVSATTLLAQAKLSTTSPDLFEASHQSAWLALRALVLQARYGLDCYAYCLLAAGHLDLVVETGLKNVDIAPLIPIIENAGGIVRCWDGGPAENGGDVIAASTPELWDAAQAVLLNAG